MAAILNLGGYVLIVLILLLFLLGLAQYAMVVRVVKLMYDTDRDLWRRSGRPGTSFFKGEPDNRWLHRTVAFQRFFKSMWLSQFRERLQSDVYRRAISGFFFV